MSASRARTLALGSSLTQGSFTNRVRKPTELMLVPMIDIFTVLVTFLLMTAVFSRITILQLDLPSADAGGAPSSPEFRLEVIVRNDGFELTNGNTLIAAVPKVAGEYDYKMLTELALQLKRDNPDVDDASVLMERQVKYDYLIQVMDAIRNTQVSGSTVSSSPMSRWVKRRWWKCPRASNQLQKESHHEFVESCSAA